MSTTDSQWKPAAAPLVTKWAEHVDPSNPLPEYPRPQLVRASWTNLNGLWDYVFVARDAAKPDQFAGQILVPFSIESALSGVGKRVSPDESLWYRRTFVSPSAANGERTILHFGGVDWQAHVYVNGHLVAEHSGGHTPFSADITSSLNVSGDNELIVKVWDPTDAGAQPRGKQIRNPHGIWYTPVTGIWQTVWLETVPAVYVKRLKLTPDVDAKTLSVEVVVAGNGGEVVDVEIIANDGKTIAARVKAKSGTPTRVEISNPKLWSPDAPFLYTLFVTLLKDDGQIGDSIVSYFAMRKVSLVKDAAGYQRIALNNTPLFLFGPLDQGWWPDGLYTAPTDEALKWDIEFTKQLGFNMCRKHIKVEPARWYYWCDKLGLAVWQDQSSGMEDGRDHFVGHGKPDAAFSPIEKVQFIGELTEMLVTLHNHPSIIAWVPFNEGWGQHDTNEILRWVKAYDPSRLVDGPSGWTDRGFGDFHDMHNYPGPGMYPADLFPERASVLGEYGGLGLPVEGHLWQTEKNWGYRTYKTKDELGDRYQALGEKLIQLASYGLAAAVYTQTTDVEGEVNGFATYDRKVIKFDLKRTSDVNRRAIEAASKPQRVVTLAKLSHLEPQTYASTLDKPAEGWEKPGFDASAWKTGEGGFGKLGNPGAMIRTPWDTSDLWLRRVIKLDATPDGEVLLNIHHHNDVVVYLNGVKAYEQSEPVGDYVIVPVSSDAAAALRAGENIVAIHGHHRGGGQYLDFGLSVATPVK